MLQIYSILNAPVDSNAYIFFDKEQTNDCIVIDCGSKEISAFVDFFTTNSLTPSYIILTHEHFDHVWSANLLREKYGAKIICSKRCAEKLAVPQNYFNLLYFQDKTKFSIEHIDYTAESLNNVFHWQGYDFYFHHTPGHTDASICIAEGNRLFTGDTILNSIKPVIKKRYGGSYADFKKSLQHIFNIFPANTTIYPGHGEPFSLVEVDGFYREYIQ